MRQDRQERCAEWNNTTKGAPGYDPKKKLGITYEKLLENFEKVWTPRKNLSIDEGTVPFKGADMNELHDLIKKGEYKVKDEISSEAKSLIKGILDTNP